MGIPTHLHQGVRARIAEGFRYRPTPGSPPGPESSPYAQLPAIAEVRTLFFRNMFRRFGSVCTVPLLAQEPRVVVGSLDLARPLFRASRDELLGDADEINCLTDRANAVECPPE